MEQLISTHWQNSLLLLLLFTSCSAQSTYYVTPTPDTPCPGEPCHTLSQYITDQYFENFTGNVRMEFLPGDHTLGQTIFFANLVLTKLTLHGNSSSFPEVTSRVMFNACGSQGSFVFAGNTELHISVLAFISGVCGGGIAILESEQQSVIVYSTFQNIPLYLFKGILTATGNTFQNTESCALSAKYSTLTLTGNMFQNNSAKGEAFFAQDSAFNFTWNTFHENSADWGGALHVEDSTLNLTGNMFQDNSAKKGGALFTQDSTLNLTGNTFHKNFADDGGALHVEDSTLNLTGNMFQYNSDTLKGGAFFAQDSTLNLTGNTFFKNFAHVRMFYSVTKGGAFFAQGSALKFTGNTFHKNFADNGGTLHVEDSTLNLTWNTFQDNSATSSGGALYVADSTLNITRNMFQNNSAHVGGVLYVNDSTLNLTGNMFQNNSVVSKSFFWFGNFPGHGAVLFSMLNSTHNLILNTFQDNSGGVLVIKDGNLKLTENTFHNNSATKGGAIYVKNCSNLSFTRNKFYSNYAIGSGGVLWLEASNLTFTDNNFTYNTASSGGAIAVSESNNVRLYGNNIIANNTAQYGGGIAIVDSKVKFIGSVFAVQNNTASYGGGLYMHNTNINISGSTIFNANSATEGGGGIYASRSIFYFTGNTTFIENSAIDGGGLLLSGDSMFYLLQNVYVYFISNSAMRNGGAIKVEESNPITYCTDAYNSDCFFKIPNLTCFYGQATLDSLADLNITMYFESNSAVEAGADLHGGSVDNCELYKINGLFSDCIIGGSTFSDIADSKNTLDISSDPLHICTCRDNQIDCTGSYHPEPVYPGGTLGVPVIARGQRNGLTTAKIQVIDTPDSIIVFQETETIQNTNKNCTTLKYTIQSTAKHSTQQMTLYAEGPCPPKTTIHPSPTNVNAMLNTLRVLVDILDCPPGFQLSEIRPICICTDRLQQFTNTCLVDDKTVLRVHDAQFWVGYDCHSRGVILHPHCPFDYCTSKETYMAVEDNDRQCSYNRSGLLCGRCSQNLSLALGSSRCLRCSNSYIALLGVFAFAGIALVLLLLVLRLTVAAGTISGLIFYANVVSVNHSATFFQPQVSNVPTVIAKVLTVFIAWLNLDLGIESCFYNGMDAYVKTWLQFAFPFYVWVLVGMIILGSYYSGRVAKIFGNNPIAVLATLFLLSYAKLLRTVIAALSYTFLDYPNNTQIAVWLYDGNIRYLSGKHIPLFTAAIICLIFLFLPYTMLLTFGQWLQAKSKLKVFSWINGRNFKPILDAYHAPYTDKHRYWTGLMLLIRFVLFLISAVNALGDPSVNLLAIISTTIAILTLPTILGARIYKMWSLSLLETSFILNLAILSTASYHIRLTGGNQNAATLTSVGIAFVTFAGIVIHHSVQQTKDTRLWKEVCLRHKSMRSRVPLTDLSSGPEGPPDAVFVSGSAPTQTVVAIREYELREPLLATD